MSADEGFLQAIIDDPDDDTVRLIYADWLDDHGNHARAEFIRVQIELARLKDDSDRRYELETRQAQLLAENKDEWLGPLTLPLDDWTFERGFLNRIEITSGILLREADRLLRLVPVRVLNVSELDETGTAEAIGQLAFLERIRELELWEDLPWDLPGLLNSPGLARLNALTVAYQSPDSRVLELLSSPTALPKLRALRFHECSIGPSALHTLASPALRERLRELCLGNVELTNAGAEALQAVGQWSSLERLDLFRNQIGEGGMRALCRLQHPGSLRSLWLGQNEFGNAGVGHLARSSEMASLQELGLGTNRLADSGARALADSPHLKQLRTLSLAQNNIGEEGARSLAASSNCIHLEHLDLNGNEVGDRGAEALGTSPHFGALRKLFLRANGLRPGGVKALLSAGKLAGVQTLDLGANLIGDMGLQILARSPHLLRLRSLYLNSNKIAGEGIKDLAALAKMPALRDLSLANNDIGDEAATVLLSSPLCRQLVSLALRDNDLTRAILPAVRDLAPSTQLRQLSLLSKDLTADDLAPVKEAFAMHVGFSTAPHSEVKRMTASPRVLVLGAHPDDADIKAGGTSSLWIAHGFEVLLVSVTDGGAGHQTLRRPQLVERRRAEAKAAGAVIGAEYQLLHFPDGELMPSLEARFRLIRLIREFRPDLILTHRPADYHPDHRYTAQLVQDAAYMVTVPAICPEEAHLERNPVILYFSDTFRKPCPFEPHVVVDIGGEIERVVDMLDNHASQFYEWLPFNAGHLDQVPEDPATRRSWLGGRFRQRIRSLADRCRDVLIRTYGEERGRTIEYVEAFEVSEYGAPLDPAEKARLFPFLPSQPAAAQREVQEWADIRDDE